MRHCVVVAISLALSILSAVAATGPVSAAIPEPPRTPPGSTSRRRPTTTSRSTPPARRSSISRRSRRAGPAELWSSASTAARPGLSGSAAARRSDLRLHDQPGRPLGRLLRPRRRVAAPALSGRRSTAACRPHRRRPSPARRERGVRVQRRLPRGRLLERPRRDRDRRPDRPGVRRRLRERQRRPPGPTSTANPCPTPTGGPTLHANAMARTRSGRPTPARTS